MKSSKSKTILAYLGLLFDAAIWGATFFLVKNILVNVDPVTLVAYRFLIAAAILAAYLLISKRSLFKNFKPGLILGLILALLYIPQTIGLVYTSAANSAFITGIFVAFIPLLNYLVFKKKPRGIQFIVILIAIFGLYLLTGGIREINPGDTITIFAAIMYAVHLIFVAKYIGDDIDIARLNFQQFLIVGGFSLLISIFFGRSLEVQSTTTIWTIIFLAILPTLSAFSIQLWSQKLVSPLRTSLIFSLEPLFGAVFAWTLGQEPFSLMQGLGGLMIVAAIIVYNLTSQHT